MVLSYLISFPLMMGEGKDGGGRPRPFPPPESSPTVGEELFFAQLGLYTLMNALTTVRIPTETFHTTFLKDKRTATSGHAPLKKFETDSLVTIFSVSIEDDHLRKESPLSIDSRSLFFA